MNIVRNDEVNLTILGSFIDFHDGSCGLKLNDLQNHELQFIRIGYFIGEFTLNVAHIYIQFSFEA